MVLDVTYRQNTGMLVARRSGVIAGSLCRTCSGRAFWKTTIHTFFLGWWGTISLIITPFFLLNNVYFGTRTLFLQKAEAAAKSSLAAQRDYALNLLKTKDDGTVIEVLMKSTGANEADVAAFVSTLREELLKGGSAA